MVTPTHKIPSVSTVCARVQSQLARHLIPVRRGSRIEFPPFLLRLLIVAVAWAASIGIMHLGRWLAR